MTLAVRLAEFVQGFIDDGFRMCPVELDHVLKVESLPLIHNDPFDRLLIAQALVENATLVTKDSTIRQYPVPTLW